MTVAELIQALKQVADKDQSLPVVVVGGCNVAFPVGRVFRGYMLEETEVCCVGSAPESPAEDNGGPFRCPTCGRFTSPDYGYYDTEPGGRRGFSYTTIYCGPECAKRMDPPARCEDHDREHCPECA